jgi:hypothetical protein
VRPLMRSYSIRSHQAAGGAVLGTVFAIVMVLAVYVASEWLVQQHVKGALTEVLQSDFHDTLEIQSVGLDGWLFSSRRTGEALAVLPSGQIVPIQFSMVGNPVTGSTLTVESSQRLKLMLRGLFDPLP